MHHKENRDFFFFAWFAVHAFYKNDQNLLGKHQNKAKKVKSLISWIPSALLQLRLEFYCIASSHWPKLKLLKLTKKLKWLHSILHYHGKSISGFADRHKRGMIVLLYVSVCLSVIFLLLILVSVTPMVLIFLEVNFKCLGFFILIIFKCVNIMFATLLHLQSNLLTSCIKWKLT